MGEAYLKCEYFKNSAIAVFRDEYVIKFNSCSSKNWCIIEKSDLVRKINDKEGLARVEILSSEQDRIQIGINDSGDCMISQFYVPRSEIKFKID